MTRHEITIDNGTAARSRPSLIPFIEGDGTGPDIWRASVRVFDAAVDKAYGGKRRSSMEGSARRRKSVQAGQQLAAR